MIEWKTARKQSEENSGKEYGYTMKALFSTPTDEDRKKFEESGLNSSCLDDKIKVAFTDDNGNSAYLFVDSPTFEKLGEEYITKNTSLSYSTALDEWIANLSQNAYYNDLQRYPEKTILLKFMEIRHEDGSEVYRCEETGYYYFRQVSAREPFARWLGCKRRPELDDGYEVRSNLVFSYNGQTEKVFYDDWNGVAAYSKTFNPDFGK